MTDAVLSGHAVLADAVASRARRLNRLRLGDILFRALTRTCAIGVLLLLGGVMVSLFIGAAPALREFGFEFLFSQSWNPVRSR